MAKKLVAYFSASGVTKRAAEKNWQSRKVQIFLKLGRFSFIRMADLDWTNKKSRCTVEMQDKKSRVEIAEKVQI
jgi:hypothetical protein